MTTAIRNTNELYGESVTFTGETLEQAVAEMQATIRMCGEDFSDVTVTEDDYEIIPVCPGCGQPNPMALEDGAVDGPREYHAACWHRLADDD